MMTTPQFQMVEDNLDSDLVTEKTINIINVWLKENNIKQNEVQKTMLFSHIKAMVHRAKTLESLPEIDPMLFNELSAQSMDLALRTVKLFNNLPIEEAYLLAVHYEVARGEVAQGNEATQGNDVEKEENEVVKESKETKNKIVTASTKK